MNRPTVIDGMPASTSTRKRSTVPVRLRPYSARKTPQPMAIGAPTSVPTPILIALPTIELRTPPPPPPVRGAWGGGGAAGIAGGARSSLPPRPVPAGPSPHQQARHHVDQE